MVTAPPPLGLFYLQTCCSGSIVRLKIQSVIGIHQVWDTKTCTVYTPKQHLGLKEKWMTGFVLRCCMENKVLLSYMPCFPGSILSSTAFNNQLCQSVQPKNILCYLVHALSGKKKKTCLWFCILLFWAIPPRGNTNELLFLPTGCSCETYELFLSCWWVMRERKIKDCHIAFSSSQSECCFINFFFNLLLCKCKGLDCRCSLAAS